VCLTSVCSNTRRKTHCLKHSSSTGAACSGDDHYNTHVLYIMRLKQRRVLLGTLSSAESAHPMAPPAVSPQ
jgi:hypothetical protein